MHITVYGHTGTVGSQLYRWLSEQGMKPAGVSLDRCDGDHEQVPEWAFVCVPTPTGARGQDLSAVESVLARLAGHELAVVIRSTVLPGTCDRIQAEHPEWYVIHWPEFLSARTAWADFCVPQVYIVGGDVGEWDDTWQPLLPRPVQTVYVDRTTAELIKYAHNLHGALQVTYANLLYDMCERAGGDFEAVKRAMPSLGYISPALVTAYWDVWRDGHRGYAGVCFPKDVDAIRHWLAGQAELLDGMAAANVRLRKPPEEQAPPVEVYTCDQGGCLFRYWKPRAVSRPWEAGWACDRLDCEWRHTYDPVQAELSRLVAAFRDIGETIREVMEPILAYVRQIDWLRGEP